MLQRVNAQRVGRDEWRHTAVQGGGGDWCVDDGERRHVKEKTNGKGVVEGEQRVVLLLGQKRGRWRVEVGTGGDPHGRSSVGGGGARVGGWEERCFCLEHNGVFVKNEQGDVEEELGCN